MDQAARPDRAFVHIGAPKTGTTFLQRILWDHRNVWPAHGVHYPLAAPDEAFHATVDVRAMPWGGQLRPEWEGAWERLARRAGGVRGDVVLSHELLCGADAEAVRRVAGSFPDRELHVVYTLRPLAAMLRSDWQEQVKHRHTQDWADYLVAVLDRGDDTHLGRWFWTHHDLVDVWGRWSAAVPPARFHVVLADAAAPRVCLWEDFAGVVGLPCDVELGDPQISPNAGLGLTATELLAQVNSRLEDKLDDDEYASVVGGTLVREVLPAAVPSDPVPLPQERRTTIDRRQAEALACLRDGGLDVRGSLSTLDGEPGLPAAPGATSGLGLTADIVAELLGALVAARGELARVEQEAAGLRHEVEQLREAVAGMVTPGPVRRATRRLAARHALVRRLIGVISGGGATVTRADPRRAGSRSSD
ncbi:MAG: hypothetical protein ACRDP1_15940 [Nocardioidaceae bacterium]